MRRTSISEILTSWQINERFIVDFVHRSTIYLLIFIQR